MNDPNELLTVKLPRRMVEMETNLGAGGITFGVADTRIWQSAFVAALAALPSLPVLPREAVLARHWTHDTTAGAVNFATEQIARSCARMSGKLPEDTVIEVYTIRASAVTLSPPTEPPTENTK